MFFLSIFIILLVTIVIRTYNINERSGLGSDSTRDALIAQEALERGELPLIGSFSSAGPFVFGPLYFWFNMLALIIMPFSFKTPWILMNITGTLTVIVLMLCGYFINGKRLAIISGLFTAFAPQLVSRSTGLTQHSLVGVTSALLLLFFILLWKKKSIKYTFLMGLSMGTALSMHYQALNFFIFIPFIFFIPKISVKRKIIGSFLFLIGALIPSLPLLYWDSQQEFANARNVLDYMLIGQYRIYVANSWKIFLFKFLIDYWSNVVGGNKVMSGIIMVITPLTIAYAFLRHKLPGVMTSLSIIFFILLLVLRFYRGERFDGYMIYIAPIIIIICAWVFNFLIQLSQTMNMKRTKYMLPAIVYIFLALIIIFDFKNGSQFVFTNFGEQTRIREAENTLYSLYPNKKFQLYDYYWNSTDASYALGGFLKQSGKTDPNGIKIGIIRGKYPLSTSAQPIYSGGWWEVMSMDKIPESQIKRPEWAPVNPNDIYDDLMKWQKTEKLTSSFHLDKFILEKLHLN